ncbi:MULTISPECIES: hypothetical protein [unclassified Microcoleus]|uniref:hypothetical protein n=1 Tax=unclassified Microcoleus TaxID=2642155 RepID=UPI002FD44F96
MKNIKQIAQDLKQAISDRDQKLALNLFRAGLQQSEAEFVGQLRKFGVLRCSNYDYQSQILNSLINETGKINISQDSQIYFKSIKSLLSISRNIQTLFKVLLKEVDYLEIKSYLVAVDSFFWPLDDPQEVDSLFWPVDGLQQDRANRYSVCKEELASAFSLYLYHSHDKKVIDKSNINKVNEKRLNDKYYLDKLEDFNKLIFFQESEVLVDSFGYTAIQNDAKIILKAPDPKFEMSRCLGYTRQSMQEIANSFDSLSELSEITEKSPSILEFSKAYYQKFKDSTFKIIDSPLKRIVMQFHPQILSKFLDSNSLFVEEEIILKQLETNLFIDYKKVNEIPVSQSLSLFDIIKVQRLFAFMLFVLTEYIDSKNLFKSKLFWRSMPVLQANELKDLLASFLGEQKAKEIFELFTWRLDKKRFDLQTHPFINVEDWILLPLGILTNSDLCRNILQSINFRFDSESSADPLVLEMERCLKPVSSIFATNLKYSFEGTQGEVDVLAVVDNCLFIFECKNSLHPCNVFELRTTYDCIQKAATQLTRFQDLWQQEHFRTYLAKKIKTQPNFLPSQLCSCIVMGNRMFSGLREQGHSVRPIRELCYIISKGEILLNAYNIYDPDAGKKSIIKFKLWKEDQLKAEDLLGYIQEDYLHNYYFNSLIRIEQTIKLKNKSLVQESYAFSHERFLEQLVDNFRFTENL